MNLVQGLRSNALGKCAVIEKHESPFSLRGLEFTNETSRPGWWFFSQL